MAKIYSFESVKRAVTCEQYLMSQGIQVGGDHRCVATWRGGTHRSVAVDGDKWYDHVEKRGGSVIDLCAAVQFGGDITRANYWLGENFGVEPVAVTKARHVKTRAEILIEHGYVNTATYHYTDENNVVVYSVMRFEKDEYGPGEKKEFVQCTPEHEGLGSNTPRLPYNLPSVVQSDSVCIVEGEKDVETLRRFGIVGTTNSGGATHFDKSMLHWFGGKDVVILPDNDEPGRKHGELLLNLLAPVAKSVKVVTISKLPKGDVTDWVEKEGGDGAKLREIISMTKSATATESPDVATAKLANAEPFRNYQEVRNGKSSSNLPIPVGHLIKECYTRFLGYPRKLGNTLFDWLRDEERIQYIENANALVAWMGSVSHHPVDWMTGQGFVSKEVFFESLMMHAKAYVSVSSAPHYPYRADVYYTYGELPHADVTHGTWKKLVSFFNPADDANRIMLACFLAAPIFYSQNCDRPLWIIDTEDQQGSGKTTLVKMCALLYGSEYAGININQLEKDPDKVYRRLLSSEARRKRVMLIDNVTKEVRSEVLASMVTDSFITGIAPYGRGEESRPNDMTYVITVNNANVNADIASRSYTVKLRKVADPDPMWKPNLIKFIEENRLQILADLIHMIETNRLKGVRRRQSRFGLFDATILTAVCSSEAEVRMADNVITKSNNDANMDLDHGQEFYDLFRERMLKTDSEDIVMRRANNMISAAELEKCVDVTKPIFIIAADVDWMLSRSDGALKTWKARDILGLIRNGNVPGFDTKVQKIGGTYLALDGVNSVPKYRGFLWRANVPTGRVDAQVIRRVGGASFEVVGIVPFTGGGCRTDGDEHDDASAQTVDVEPVRTPTLPAPEPPPQPAPVQEPISPALALKRRMLAASRPRQAAQDTSPSMAASDTVSSEMSPEDEFMSTYY